MFLMWNSGGEKEEFLKILWMRVVIGSIYIYIVKCLLIEIYNNNRFNRKYVIMYLICLVDIDGMNIL